MSVWIDTTLDDVLTLQRGFDITKKEQIKGNVPIVSSSGIKSYHNKAKVKAPGVVIGRSGSLGTVHFVCQDYWPHNTTLWVKDFKGNLPEFIYHFLKVMHLEAYDTGSSNPSLNRNHVHKIKLRFPALPIQKKIAAVLSAYDDLIENNNRRIFLLEKMAEEIYREWFVRLRFPGHEGVAFHKGIPEGWEIKRFDEFCLLQRGYDLPNRKIKSGKYPIVASTSIKAYHNTFKVKAPVITTGRSGSLGTVLFVDSPAWPLNTALFVKNFFGNSPYLIYYTLKSLKLENFNAGAGVPSLNRNHLGSLKMSVPPDGLQSKFDEHIAVIFNQKAALLKSIEALKKTRDRLLTRLISGKLSVEDLNIQFPPSMIDNS